MKDTQVRLGDGRTLAYTDMGDPAGRCVFYFHGAPASRRSLGFLEEHWASRGVRVVSPDRPGYGGSSPQPGRSMADWPADVAALADALGVDRFAVCGLSSGGPYAVACCALLPERVTGGVVVAGTTDMSWPQARQRYPQAELDLMDQPDEDAAVAWCAARYGADGGGLMADADPSEAWPQPDAALLADDRVRRHLAAATAEAFRQGVAGYAQDVFVQGRPWPFAPGRIQVPVAVVHGERDTLVPMAHSRHTAELVPGARFRTLPGHGHVSILTQLPGILAAFLESLA